MLLVDDDPGTIVVTAASDLTLGAFDHRQVFRLLRKPLAWSGLMRAIRDCMDAQHGVFWEKTTQIKMGYQ